MLFKKKCLKIKVFRNNHKKKTAATAMIMTLKNFLIGEQRRCHDVGMVQCSMSVSMCRILSFERLCNLLLIPANCRCSEISWWFHINTLLQFAKNCYEASPINTGEASSTSCIAFEICDLMNNEVEQAGEL